MNIYQKLIEVRKSVPYLKKDNAGFQFKYVSSSQTLGSLREAMDEQGLLLIPRVISTEVRDHTTRKGDHEYFSIFNMTFTWVNAEKPEETIECSWCGHGLDDGEKGVGKALTYSEKYFLLKFFNIATDKDDPDSLQKQETKATTQATTQKPPTTQATASQTGEKKHTEAEYRIGMSRMLEEMWGGDPDAIANAIKGYTTFISKKDGTTFEGKTSVADLNAKTNAAGQSQLSVTFHKVEKEYKEWQNKNEGGLI
jgi:hypothetical protein